MTTQSAPVESGGQGVPVTLLRRLLAVLASQELAVVLLVYLGLLTLMGTFAQIELGLYRTQQIFFEGWSVPAFGPVRIPGAYPVMALLFVNLVVGGVARLRWNWRNAGILITHFGIAFLLLQGFVKLHYSVSGHLTLYEGQGGNTFVSFHEWELALLRQDGDTVRERTVPASAFVHADGARPAIVTDPSLPFRVELRHWRENCEPMPKGPMVRAELPVVAGVTLVPQDVRPEREHNVAGCYATVRHSSDGAVLAETILWGWDRGRPTSDPRLPRNQDRYPFTFEVDGQRWGLDLRRVTMDLPFAVHLDRFVRVTYPGTELPKEFSSYVTVRDAAGEQASHIYMNNPLRRDGFVLYQASWGPQGGRPPWYSVFEVAQNPSDRWSILACTVIAVGLLIHFLRKLWNYIRAENLKAAHQAAAQGAKS